MANPIAQVEVKLPGSRKRVANLEALPDDTYVLRVGDVTRGQWQLIVLTFDEIAKLMEPVRPAYEARVAADDEPKTHYLITRSPRLPSKDTDKWLGRPRPWNIIVEDEMNTYVHSSWSTHIEAVLELERVLKEGKA